MTDRRAHLTVEAISDALPHWLDWVQVDPETRNAPGCTAAFVAGWEARERYEQMIRKAVEIPTSRPRPERRAGV